MNRFLLGVIVALVVFWLSREGCNYYLLKKRNNEIAQLREKLIQPPTIQFIESKSIPDTHYVPKPYPVKGETVYIDRLVTIRDTSDIAYLLGIKEDYFRTRFYPDTITTPYGKVWLTDSVTQNRISFRETNFDLFIPEKHYHDTIYRKVDRGRVFVGINGLDYNGGAALGGGVDWATKQGHLFGVSVLYDFNLNRPIYQGTLKLQIK